MSQSPGRPGEVSARAACSIVLALLAAKPAAVFAGDGFQYPARIADLSSPPSVRAGDFNRDGRLDLAALGGTSQVVILLQDPTDRNAWRRLPPVVTGLSNFQVRAADFDADGDDDLVVADVGSQARVLRCRGDGTFEPPVPLPEAELARWVTIGDWNRDGVLDLAAANDYAGTVAIFLGDGRAGFDLLRIQPAGGKAHSIEAFDYQADGELDLAVGLDSRGVVPWKGEGGAVFNPQPPVPETIGCHRNLLIADFNGDGLSDLVHGCGVSTNLGEGFFRKTLGVCATSAAAADFDGDGLEDLAAECSRGNLEVFRGKGDGQFHPRRAIGPTSAAQPALAAADLDQDGRPDLIATDDLSSGISVFWGNGGPLFLDAGALLPGVEGARALAIADLDGEGSPDVLVSRATGSTAQAFLEPVSPAKTRTVGITVSGSFSALEALDLDGDATADLAGLSAAAGTVLVALLGPDLKVRSQKAYSAGQLPVALAAGRVDGDETADLVVACAGSGHLAVFLNRGSGEFAEARLVPTISTPRDAALADLNGDGRPEAVVLASGELGLHYGMESGEFGEPVRVTNRPGGQLSKVAVGDFDRDGLPDLAVSDRSRNAILLFYQNRSGAFEEAPSLPVGSDPISLALADLDGDRIPDLTTANSTGQSVTVIRNRGDRRFADPVNYPLGFAPLSHRLGDLDRDGTPDLVALGASNAVIFLGRRGEGTGVLFRRGDADGDGRVEVNDPIAILGRLFLGGSPLGCEDGADANDDGEVNLSDPIAILNRLFLGGEPLPPPGPEACGADGTPDGLTACRTSGC